MTDLLVKSVRWGENEDYSHNHLLYGQVRLEELLMKIREGKGVLISTGPAQAVFIGSEVTRHNQVTFELHEPKSDTPTR